MNKLENIIAKQLYYEIKNILISKKILAFNVRQFSNKAQQVLQEEYNVKYNQLSQQQKNQFDQNLNRYLSQVEDNIRRITDNSQYQDWLCRLVKTNKLDLHELYLTQYDFNDQDDSYLLYFQKMFKNYDIIKQYQEDKKFKNITTFKDQDQLQDYITKSFKKYNSAISLKNKKRDISKLFYKQMSIGKYDVYAIQQGSKTDFQTIYGQNGYKCAWCVTNENSNHWGQYVYSGNLYLLTYSNSSKPAALLYVPQGGITDYDLIQFRNIHNDEINVYDNDISEIIFNVLDIYEINQDNVKDIINLYYKLKQKEKEKITDLMLEFLYNVPKNGYSNIYPKLSDFYESLSEDDQLKLFKHWIQNQKGNGKRFIDFLIEWDIINHNTMNQQFQQLCLKHKYYRIFIEIVIYDDGVNMSDEQQQRYINIYLTHSNCRNFITKRLSSDEPIYFNYENFKLLFQKAQNQEEQMKIITSAYRIQNDEEKIAKFLAPIFKKWLQQKNKVLNYFDLDSYFGQLIMKYVV